MRLVINYESHNLVEQLYLVEEGFAAVFLVEIVLHEDVEKLKVVHGVTWVDGSHVVEFFEEDLEEEDGGGVVKMVRAHEA